MTGAAQVLGNAALALLAVAAALCLVRVARGPSALDRVIALDVFAVVLASGVAVRGTVTDGGVDLVLLVVISLLGFAGSVAAARLVERRQR